jgi:hypothetical protein
VGGRQDLGRKSELLAGAVAGYGCAARGARRLAGKIPQLSNRSSPNRFALVLGQVRIWPNGQIGGSPDPPAQRPSPASPSLTRTCFPNTEIEKMPAVTGLFTLPPGSIFLFG